MHYLTIYGMFFAEDRKTMLIDIDSRAKEEIIEHLIKVVGKSKEILAEETIAKEKKDNRANIGTGCEKACICHIPGQVPCPGVVPLPDHMRAKIILQRLSDN